MNAKYRNLLEALEAIEKAPQGNARLKSLKENDSPELRELLVYALDPSITFGVKKLPKYINKGECYGSGLSWSFHLKSLLRLLESRKSTGNDAQDRIEKYLAICNPIEAKWAERIIKRDLRINLGAKDVNNALGEEVIYLFQVPLATDYIKVPEKKLTGHWIIQPKLDGARVIAILPENQGRVKLLSRTGKEWDNFESVRAELQRMNHMRSGSTIYLDGEVVSKVNGHIDFQALQKTMMRDDGKEIGELQYVVFDATTESGWKNPQVSYRNSYRHRFDFAGEVLENLDSKLVALVEVAQKTDCLSYALLEQWCIRYVGKGYEGAMARSLDNPVENKRSKLLLKVKTFHDAEADLIGIVEGAGKYIGTLGALICETENGVQFEIGTGLDDAQRKELWEAYKNSSGTLQGKITYKFQNLTDDKVPRFPVFKCFRDSRDII